MKPVIQYKFYVSFNCPSCGEKQTIVLRQEDALKFYNLTHEDHCWRCQKKTGLHILQSKDKVK